MAANTNDLESLRQINENIDTQLQEAEKTLSKKPSILCTEGKLLEGSGEAERSKSPTPAIGTKATIRIQKAEIEALTNQVKVGVQNNRDLQAQVENLMAELTKKKNHCANSSATPSFTTKAPSTTTTTNPCSDVSKLRSELRSVKTALISCQQSLEGERRSGHVKLQKALQEANKYKRCLANVTKENNSSSGGSSIVQKERSERTSELDTCIKERDALAQKAKQLERQRQDLMTALKHQQRLIHTLKRQRKHAESVKVLTFKEETFVKEIGWDTQSCM
jgi:chromosome segregation ATPase